MLATILRSPRATATTFAIIESFFKLRTLVRNVNIMATEYDEEKRKSLVPVSYTHLDVYKRQLPHRPGWQGTYLPYS